MPGELGALVFIVTAFIWLFINAAFALGVGADAGNLPEGRKPILVGKWIWFFTVLFGGPFFAIAYWVLHHTMISPFVHNACNRNVDV